MQDVPKAQHDTFTVKDRYTYDEVLAIMAYLRSDKGCPWDREQTHETLRKNLIEEAYEVVDAIDSGRPERLQDELGDLFLQVLFHAEIARSEGQFYMDDVMSGLGHKLVSRHTHIFGEDQGTAKDGKDALATWEKNKIKEKGLKSASDALLDVPRYLPALSRANKIQKKAANVGFDWPDVSGALDKLAEESLEFKETLAEAPGPHREEEAGDLLFAVVNALRLAGIDPEIALSKANDKFIRRFVKMEERMTADGRHFEGMSLDEMDQYWDRVKAEEKAEQQAE